MPLINIVYEYSRYTGIGPTGIGNSKYMMTINIDNNSLVKDVFTTVEINQDSILLPYPSCINSLVNSLFSVTTVSQVTLVTR